jgi:glycosyltransferase involved in cell wall biosynthesis
MDAKRPAVLILGTRGIPAAHGGFETFAERLALHLVARGWDVTVYCQREVTEAKTRFETDTWAGIRRVHVNIVGDSPGATVAFDWHCVRDAAKREGVCLVLGYNTALFLAYLRLHQRPIITNMDGIEWRRLKWGFLPRAWLYANEWLALRLSQRLVADHPRIADHIQARSGRTDAVMIPYGADPVFTAPEAPVRALGLEPGRYLVSIARIEPDNSLLTIIRAFSRRKRGMKLAVLGLLDTAHPYHRDVVAAASDEVVFTGAIYDTPIVAALRVHARAHCHGHQVGGTNPSLVEAMSAGSAIIAHRNPFNLWTAGADQFFFDDEESCSAAIDEVVEDDAAVTAAKAAARDNASARFGWLPVLTAYEREIAALGGYTETLPASSPWPKNQAMGGPQR